MYSSDVVVEKPVLYQSNPVRSSSFLNMASPTFNEESRKKWASKFVRRVESFHRDNIDPDYFATMKFNEVLTVDEIKQLRRKRSESVRYYNRKDEIYLGGIYCLDIEPSNICHEHLLIRSSMSHQECRKWFENWCSRTNKKLGRKLSMSYFEGVENSEAASKYLFKLVSDKEPLLLKRHLGLRLSGVFGRYYGGGSVREYNQSGVRDYLVKKYESDLEAI